MNKNIVISVGTVVSNSQASVLDFIKDVLPTLKKKYKHFELVIVDNGSTDQTLSLLQKIVKKEKNIRVICLSKKYSSEIAQIAVLENCIGDFIVLMDANYDPPKEISRVIEAAYAGNDIVIAERRKVDKEFFHALFSPLFYKLSYIFTGYKLSPYWSNFICLSRKAANAIILTRTRNKSLKYLRIEVGYKHKVIYYDEINRTGLRHERLTISKISDWVEGIVGTSSNLLKIMSRCGFILGCLNLVYIFYIIFVNLFQRHIAPGWTSTSFILAVMFSFVIFNFSVIGEYIAYLYEEIKKGPLYHVRDEINSSFFFEHSNKKNIVEE
jgi:glycosyltransferase involved in cell wall biosynthesis